VRLVDGTFKRLYPREGFAVSIIAEGAEKKRRPPLWLLAPTVGVVALVGGFAWSCFQQVAIDLDEQRGILFGLDVGPLITGWGSVPVPGGGRCFQMNLDTTLLTGKGSSYVVVWRH
jgi:hypothetical protein